MGFFNKSKPQINPTRVDKPPAGGTAHQRKCAAADRQNALMQAISQRGRELGLNSKDVLRVMDQAENELRRRGQHPDQLPAGDPIADFDLYGI